MFLIQIDPKLSMFFFWYFQLFCIFCWPNLTWFSKDDIDSKPGSHSCLQSIDYGIVYIQFCIPRKFFVKQGGALYSPTFIFDPIRYFHFWLLGLFKGVCCRCSCTDQPSTLRGDFLWIEINIIYVKITTKMGKIVMISMNCTCFLDCFSLLHLKVVLLLMMMMNQHQMVVILLMIMMVMVEMVRMIMALTWPFGWQVPPCKLADLSSSSCSRRRSLSFGFEDGHLKDIQVTRNCSFYALFFFRAERDK